MALRALSVGYRAGGKHAGQFLPQAYFVSSRGFASAEQQVDFDARYPCSINEAYLEDLIQLCPDVGSCRSRRRARWLCRCDQGCTTWQESDVYRRSWKAWRNMSQCRVHSFQGAGKLCLAGRVTLEAVGHTPACMQALLNSSQKYHDALDNFSSYGVEVDNVRFVLEKMMQQKDKAVNGLTSGIEGLFKKNKVCLTHEAAFQIRQSDVPMYCCNWTNVTRHGTCLQLMCATVAPTKHRILS